MCSIIGYRGKGAAAPVIVSGLKRMEYRGYDSVGVATESGKKINLKKGIGRVAEVNSSAGLDALPGTTGIGHTRWATHGKVTRANAHPHSSNSGSIAIVHNGIIENFEELKSSLSAQGYTFESETDTEVIANLLQKNHDATGSVKEAVVKTVSEIEGHYAFVAMFEDGQLAAARFHEPLILGIGQDDLFLSSDVLGFIEYTDDAVYMKDGSFAMLEDGKFQIFDFDGTDTSYEVTKVSKEFGDAYKGDYAHFTLKEIYEQPETVMRAGEKTTDAIKTAALLIRNTKSIYVTGSGTSYNAALLAKQILSRYAKIKVEPIISSELPFSPDIIEDDSVFVAMSQSGESADVLEAVRIAKQAGCKIISIVNLTSSSLARESDIVIGMNCGPEIGVAATKSFTAQLAVLYKLAEQLGGQTGTDFGGISESMLEMLENPTTIQQIAGKLRNVSDIYVLGRGIHYPIAIEAALKLKELTYIHAEGIAGGELKHGPLALMDSGVYVIIINPDDTTYSDTLTSAREIKTRGAKIIGISNVKSDVYDYWIEIPSTGEESYPILEIVPVQLLSYYAALEKDTDPDYPRNLAKSVTVK
ncbi:MAG: glutamine--fructose-6-phosphate transaminase (isomerizing) [Nitrosopumilus sp. B06]|nr:MAG: glutamine--fructose-6-phosphate transaminase (isomerizing) [Nitrosopumilus sp. D6]RNJ80726.1 MAG: glutamine--fructose-6-phosphate transaminase (isomerizing) [Nitrosopumilus sp. B06]